MPTSMTGSPPEGGWLDAEISDSFPASDPPSHWAGPPRRTSEADRAHGLLVPRQAVEDAPERANPERPRPGTLGHAAPR
jgi:hypothetical protein